jgi:hypothetical protein
VKHKARAVDELQDSQTGLGRVIEGLPDQVNRQLATGLA